MQFQFESLQDFLLMAGHGGFVWASYSITFFVLITMALMPFIHKQRFSKRLWRHQRINESRQGLAHEDALENSCENLLENNRNNRP